MAVSRKSLYLIITAVVVIGMFLIGMTMNLGTGLVRDKLAEAARENLDSEVVIGVVNGNPFKGYDIDGVTISTEEGELLAVERLSAKVSIFSFLTGSAPVSTLTIDGFNSDVEKINRLIARIDTDGGGGDIPVKRVQFVNSTFSSPWAVTNIKKLALSFDENNVTVDIDAMVDGVPLKGDISVAMPEEGLTLRGMDVKIGGQGRITAEGQLTPALSVDGEMKDLDVGQLIAFWPDMKSSNYKGLFSSTFKTRQTWQDPDISGEFSYNGELIAGIPVSKASARWRYKENRLDIAGMDGVFLGFPVGGNLAFVFEPEKPARMLVDLQGSAADLAELEQLSYQFGSLSGKVDKFNISMQGEISKPEGKISFEAQSLGFREYSVTGTSLSANIKGGNANIIGNTVFEGAPVSFNGVVSDFMVNPSVNIKGTLRSLSLAALSKAVPTLSDMKVSGTINADYKAKGKPSDLSVSGKAWSPKLTYNDQVLQNPSVFFDYSGNSLKLSDLNVEWEGTALSGGGTISNLTGKDRTVTLDLKAQNLDSQFIEGFYPPAKDYEMKGSLTASVKAKGKLTGPSLDLEIASPSLGIMNSYRLKNLSASTSLKDLKGGVPSDLSVVITADAATGYGIALESVRVELVKKDKGLNITNGSARMGAGTLNIDGSLTMEEPFENSPMNLAIDFEQIDLAKLSFSPGQAVPLAGTASGKLSVEGTAGSPRVGIKISAPSLAAYGFNLNDVNFVSTGDMQSMKIDQMTAGIGQGMIQVTGEVKPEAMTADLELKGQELDSKKFTSRIEKLQKYEINGKVNVDFKGHFEEGSSSGSGKLTSPMITVAGISFNDIVYPLKLQGNRLLTSDAVARLYSGEVAADGTVDFSAMSFSENLQVKGTRIDALIKDAVDLEGSITGTADAVIKLKGSFKDGLSYSGRGLLEVKEGKISGFKAVDILSRLHGMDSIRYLSVYAPFNIDTVKLVLEEDTMVKAPQGDPLYRYISATGPITMDGKLNLLCEGNMNMRLLNALLGGVGGAASGLGSTGDLEGLISGVLQGALKGAGTQLEKDDFRDVTMKIGGTLESPSISNVKVSSPPQPEQPQAETAQPASPVSPPSPDTMGDQKLKQKDPAQQKPEDVEDQIKKEILKKIFE